MGAKAGGIALLAALVLFLVGYALYTPYPFYADAVLIAGALSMLIGFILLGRAYR